jgi:hypothetical protein
MRTSRVFLVNETWDTLHTTTTGKTANNLKNMRTRMTIKCYDTHWFCNTLDVVVMNLVVTFGPPFPGHYCTVRHTSYNVTPTNIFRVRSPDIMMLYCEISYERRKVIERRIEYCWCR